MTARRLRRARLLFAVAAALALIASSPAKARHDLGRAGYAGALHHGSGAFPGHRRHAASLGRHGEASHAVEGRGGFRDWHRHDGRADAGSDGFWRGERRRSEFLRRVSFASRSERFESWDWHAWGWGWHAGLWPWAAWAWPSLAIGISFGVVAAPPVIVAPPLFYAAPPPIVAALPAIAPPAAAPPSLPRTPVHGRPAAPPSRAPLPPPAAEALLGAALPPPIVVLPPPLVIAAAVPPPPIFTRPELALVIAPPALAFARVEPDLRWDGWVRGRVAGWRETALTELSGRRVGFGEVHSHLRDRHGREHWAWGGLRHGARPRAGLGNRHPSSHGLDFGGWREARRSVGPDGRH